MDHSFFLERHERRIAMITRNMVFSQGDQISENPIMTMAPIGPPRPSHVIAKMGEPSIRVPEPGPKLSQTRKLFPKLGNWMGCNVLRTTMIRQEGRLARELRSRVDVMVDLGRFRRSQVIPVALLLVGLPYLAIRCVGAPGGCEVMPARAPADTSPGEPGHHAHQTDSGQHHNQGSPHIPDRTCCEQTGKCDIKVTVSAPAVDPPALVATLASVVRLSARWTAVVMITHAAQLAHGPPLYLLHAALLI